MRLLTACFLALAFGQAALPSAFAQGTWTVDSLRIDGQQVAELPDVQRRDKGGEPFRRVSLQRGGTLPEGAEIAVPARGGVELASPNGNRLVLYAGSRMVLLHASGKGERYQQGEGRVRFIVNKALDFFNVHTPERFLAAVKGTEYEMNLVPTKSIEFRVLHGVVEVERTGKVRVEDAGGEARVADNIVAAERVFAGETKQYDLSAGQYLARFRTYQDAEEYFRQALEQAERSGDLTSIRRARQNLGWILIELSKYEDARSIFESQLKDAEQRGDDLDKANALWGHGLARNGLRQHAAAIQDYKKALTFLILARGGIDHHTIAALYQNLVAAHQGLGDYSQAIVYSLPLIEMRKQLVGDRDDEEIAGLYQNLGVSFVQMDEYRKAIGYFEQSLAMRKRLFGNRDHKDISGLYKNLGIGHSGLNEYRRAIGYFEQALAMLKRLYGNLANRDMAEAYELLGMAHGYVNEAQTMVGYLEQALDMRKRLAGNRDHYDLADAYNNLGFAYEVGKREYGRAAEYYRLALDMWTRLANGKDDRRIVLARRNLADALEKGGDLAAASKLRAEAATMAERLKQPKPQ